MAQKECSSFDYLESEAKANPSVKYNVERVESFIQQKLRAASGLAGRPHVGSVIKIPVVVHVLYNKASENVTDEIVLEQIKILNDNFRRRAADTSNTPEWFKSIAADCGIEFQLATSDPQRRATTGIVRKYTSVTRWSADDQMKQSAKGGADAWDSKSYLNIWVCNLGSIAGYSSFPGGPDDKDGVVITRNVFGKSSRAGYEQGKTAVHEVGHWLGLRHIWGDSYCGDDWVNDTPKQGNFTPGCPAGIRTSCSSGPHGDMYMNFMDLTQDGCINMFTEGQKKRMRTLFETDGARNGILSSVGLLPALYPAAEPFEEVPTTLQAKIYPNPATSEIILDLSYDIRWMGQVVRVINLQGQPVTQATANTKLVKIDIAKLTPGIYFLLAKKEDGETIKQKFIKL